MMPSLLRLILIGLAVGCWSSQEGPFEGQEAPTFNAGTMAGTSFEFDRLKGKPTMLVFWASWCGPCRQEAPDVVKVHKSYGTRINLVGINAGEKMVIAQRAAQQMGIAWPVAMDVDGTIQRLYKVSGIPMVLILDENGVVRHRNNGVPSDVHRLLDGLLG